MDHKQDSSVQATKGAELRCPMAKTGGAAPAVG